MTIWLPRGASLPSEAEALARRITAAAGPEAEVWLFGSLARDGRGSAATSTWLWCCPTRPSPDDGP